MFCLLNCHCCFWLSCCVICALSSQLLLQPSWLDLLYSAWFQKMGVAPMVAIYCCGALYCQYLVQPHSLALGKEAAFACYITLSSFLLYKPNGKRDKVIVLVAVWPSGPRLGASGTSLEEWRWTCCDGASIHDGAKCNWIVILQQYTLISVCFGQCCRWVELWSCLCTVWQENNETAIKLKYAASV